MSIVGFGLTTINAAKEQAIKGKVDINNNVSIKDVKPADLSLGKDKSNAVKFVFTFTSAYEQEISPSKKDKIGNISFEGEVIYMEDPKKIKAIQDNWKKDKKIDQAIMSGVLNHILNKCNVQALIVSQDINLPPPIPLPRVQVGNQQPKK